MYGCLAGLGGSESVGSIGFDSGEGCATRFVGSVAPREDRPEAFGDEGLLDVDDTLPALPWRS